MVKQGNKGFVERVERIFQTYGKKIAITYLRNDGTQTLFTFGEIFARIQAAKEQFLRLGLRPGDRVAIISQHSPYAVVAGFALAYANITIVNIDRTLPTEEINRLLNFSDVRAVFTTPAIYEKLDKTLLDGIPALDLAWNDKEYKIFDGSADKVTRAATADPDTEVCVILYSSGTTSVAKGVEITYAATMESLVLNMMITDATADSSLLHILPTCHIAGFASLWGFYLWGGGVGMIEDVDASKLQHGLKVYNPTHFLVVPKVYDVMTQKIRHKFRSKGRALEKIFNSLLSMSGFFYKNFGLNVGKVLFKPIRSKALGNNIRVLGTGGGACSKETAAFMLNFGIGVWANFYASTETNIPGTATGVFDRYPAGTEGLTDRFKEIQVKIHNPDETGTGEIRVKTKFIMKGYFRDPELTAASFDEEGYLKTGDLGHIDAKGYIHVTGRIKEAIHMRTGKKVAPNDVDIFYNNVCPDVILASCGVPHRDESYDEIHLFVEKGEFSDEDQKTILKTIMGASSRKGMLYKLAGVHFIDKLPLTAVGKVKRYILRDQIIAERQRN